MALLAGGAFAPGTIFVYDQQSSDEGNVLEGWVTLQGHEVGQSFIPTLDAVGFVRLRAVDGTWGNGTGPSLQVLLRADSMTGPVLAASLAISFADTEGGFRDFIFPTPVSVTPGQPYFFQTVLAAGPDDALFYTGRYGYANGELIADGVPRTTDFWFREGIVVPEFSVGWLVLLGVPLLWWVRRWRKC